VLIGTAKVLIGTAKVLIGDPACAWQADRGRDDDDAPPDWNHATQHYKFGPCAHRPPPSRSALSGC